MHPKSTSFQLGNSQEHMRAYMFYIDLCDLTRQFFCSYPPLNYVHPLTIPSQLKSARHSRWNTTNYTDKNSNLSSS